MVLLSDPFSYKQGGAKSLLDSALSVEGCYIGVPRSTSGLILRKGPKTGFDPENAFSSELEAYAAHYKTHYDEGSVDRHMSTLLSGGQEMYLDCRPGELVLSRVEPTFTLTPTYAQVCAGTSAACDQFLRDGYNQNEMNRALRRVASKALAGIATFESEIQAGEIPRGTLLSWLGRDPAMSVSSPFFMATSALTDAPLTGASLAPLSILTPLLEPGYILVLCCNPTIQGGNENYIDPWVLSALKFRCVKPTTLAVVSFKCQPIISGDWIQAGIRVFFDSWNFGGSSSAPTLGVSGTPGYYSTGDKKLTAHAVFGSQLGTITVVTQPTSAIPPEPVNFAPATAPQGRWSFPAAYGSHSFPITNRDTMRESYKAKLGIPSTTDEWIGANATDRLIFHRAIYGHSKLYIGCDLTSNRIVDYEYRIADLPAPKVLSGDLVRVDCIDSIVTRVSSARIVEVLQAVETRSAESMTELRVSMETTPRVFYGGVWAERAVPMASVLARTEIQRTALDADDDMSLKIFLPKDADDVNSVDVTYKQADNLCQAFRANLDRRGIVVTGPSLGYDGPVLTPKTGLVGGKLVFVHPVTGAALTADEETAVFAAIQRGALVLIHDFTNPLVTSYVSDPRPTYPDAWDLVCLEVFGKRYGEITTTAGAGSDKSWTVEGQLGSSGFLRDPATWTPEFWLTVCGSKSWRIETLLGTLLTNPYGVGSLTQATIRALE